MRNVCGRCAPWQMAMVVLGIGLTGASARSQEDEEPSANSEPGADGPGEAAESGHLTVFADPNGIVYVDGASTERSTPLELLELPGGLHYVMVYVTEWDHFTVERAVDIRSGVELQLTFHVVSAEPTVEPLPDPPPGVPEGTGDWSRGPLGR